MIVRPPAAVPPDEWDDTIWGAAGALALFDAEVVTDLLVRFFASGRPVPQRSRQQLAYIAGRARVQDRAVLTWLIELLLHDPAHATKSRALQALAWLSRSLNSLEWLDDLLPDLDGLSVQGPAVPLVQRIIQAIAAWDTAFLDRLGSFQTQAAAPEDDEQVHQMATLDLRRRAIEALALIGNQQTLDTLYPQVPEWPLVLREAWHISSAAIRSRLQLANRDMKD
jgi:HEAT repeat protein